MSITELKKQIVACEENLAQARQLFEKGSYAEAEHATTKTLNIVKPILESADWKAVNDNGAIKSDIVNLTIHAYHRLANIYLEKSDYSKAIDYANTALLYCEQYDSHDRVNGLYVIMGNSYRSLSDFSKALECFNKALEQAEHQENKQGIASAMSGMGSVYQILRDYSLALDYYSKALEIFKSQNFKQGLSSLLSNIGNVYVYLTDHDSAMEYYMQALAIHKESGNKAGEALCYGNISIVHQNHHDYQSALEYSDKAILKFEELGMKTSLAVEHANMGVIYILMKDYNRSNKYLTRSLQLAEEVGQKSLIASVTNLLGTLYAQEENPNQNDSLAENYFLASISLSSELNNKEYEPYKMLSQIYKKQSRWQESQEYFEKFYDLEKEVQSQEAKKQAENMEYRRKIEESERDRQVKIARFQEQEKILLNILPAQIAERILEGEKQIADLHEHVSVFFSDIVGFTQLSQKISPDKLLSMLNEIFSEFDRIARKHGLEKIKTIGDAYMAVAGVPLAQEDHAERAAAFALDVIEYMKIYRQTSNSDLQIRVGLHCGKAIAGVIGENKFAYDLWGDSVNTASRMESHGEAGRIHVSEDFKKALSNSSLNFIERGEMEVKGKGMMKTYFLNAN